MITTDAEHERMLADVRKLMDKDEHLTPEEDAALAVDTAMVLPTSMVNIRMPLESSLFCPTQSSELCPVFG